MVEVMVISQNILVYLWFFFFFEKNITNPTANIANIKGANQEIACTWI